MTGRRAAGDHYSSIAASYAAFRPRYPRALFEYAASLAPARAGPRRAWDCGAGSGQATTDLAEFFDEVIGTDVSAKQIARAPRHPKVRWVVASAEVTPLASESVDVVTVAQALHWFDHARFYAEVRRVCVPGGAIAAWTYAAPTMAGDAGLVLRRYMFEDVGAYWPPERKYVDEHYETIPFPFERIAAPEFAIRTAWTLPQVAGYLRSMSATVRCAAKTGDDPVIAVESELGRLWGGDDPRPIEWPVAMVAGRI